MEYTLSTSRRRPNWLVLIAKTGDQATLDSLATCNPYAQTMAIQDCPGIAIPKGARENVCAWLAAKGWTSIRRMDEPANG